MSKKVSESKKAISRPISLFPEQLKFANNQANHAGNLSRYFQLLVEYDKENNILADAMTLTLKKQNSKA